MREATVSDLKKNFPKILRWVEAGERVQITRKGVPVAVLGPTVVEMTAAETTAGEAPVVAPAVAATDELDRVMQLDELLQNPMLTEEEVARMSGELP